MNPLPQTMTCVEISTPGGPEVLLTRQSELAHVGGVRSEDDAVAQREVAQLQRLRQVDVPPGHAGEGSTGARLVRSSA